MFTGIHKQYINYFWPDLADLIQKALDREPNKYTLENVKKSLDEGTSQVWICRDHIEIEMIAVTKIVEFYAKKVLFIEMVAGKNLYKWIDNLDTIKKWGTNNGCQSLEFSARKGFRKYLRSMNFKEKMIVYEGTL